MKTLAIIVNIFAPGVGTLIIKKWVQGIIQLVLMLIALTLNITGIGAVLGIPIAIIVWIWAIISAVSYQPTPSR